MLAAADRRGDFERLYREHYPLVVRTVYLMILDRDIAQEITHEAFLRLWQHGARIERGGNTRAWLMKVAVNLAIDHRRSLLASVRQRLAPPRIEDPAQLALARLDRQRMRQALLKLPVRDRAILVLRFEQDLTFPEIGRVLGRPEATVKTWVHRALNRLERDLDGPNSERAVDEV